MQLLKPAIASKSFIIDLFATLQQTMAQQLLRLQRSFLWGVGGKSFLYISCTHESLFRLLSLLKIKNDNFVY